MPCTETLLFGDEQIFQYYVINETKTHINVWIPGGKNIDGSFLGKGLLLII